MKYNKPLITVITVTYNAVSYLEETILSVINQSYANIEYIIIDGNSTDGTLDIIKKYDDKISYWISEPDNGIYDAMNKGIEIATGDWINFMNAGDVFCKKTVIADIFDSSYNYDKVDVIYGDSLQKDISNNIIYIKSGDDIDNLQFHPIYRHGASFVRGLVHKKNKFDLTKSDIYGFALDFYNIYTLYKKGYRFKKSDNIVLIYLLDGISNNPIKSMVYDYLITHNGVLRPLDKIKLAVKKTKIFLFNLPIIIKPLRIIHAFFSQYVMNFIISYIPIWSFRRFYYKRCGIKIGKNSILNMSQYITSPHRISIGENTHINRGCFIDGRGSCFIGNNVSISHNVSLVTGGHDYNSKTFSGIYVPITIKDYAWIGINVTILQGIVIGKGAVVAAGSVVTKDVEDFTIVGGIPAKVIGKRRHDLDYKCKWELPFV